MLSAAASFVSKAAPLSACVNGGEGGIRTPGPLRDTAFRERHHKPLGHLSAAYYSIGRRQLSERTLLGQNGWGGRRYDAVGAHDQALVVLPGRAVEGTAAGDKGHYFAGGRADDLVYRRLTDGQTLQRRDVVLVDRPVLQAHLDEVVLHQVAEIPENGWPDVVVIDVAGEDGVPAEAGTGAEVVPGDVVGVARGLHDAVSVYPQRDDVGIDAGIGNDEGGERRLAGGRQQRRGGGGRRRLYDGAEAGDRPRAAVLETAVADYPRRREAEEDARCHEGGDAQGHDDQGESAQALRP